MTDPEKPPRCFWCGKRHGVIPLHKNVDGGLVPIHDKCNEIMLAEIKKSGETPFDKLVHWNEPLLCATCKNREFPETPEISLNSQIRCTEFFWTNPTWRCRLYAKKE